MNDEAVKDGCYIEWTRDTSQLKWTRAEHSHTSGTLRVLHRYLVPAVKEACFTTLGEKKSANSIEQRPCRFTGGFLSHIYSTVGEKEKSEAIQVSLDSLMTREVLECQAGLVRRRDLYKYVSEKD